MNLLILHLQNVLQALQVLLDVFIRCQSVLVSADVIRVKPFVKDSSGERGCSESLRHIHPGSTHHYLFISAPAKSFFKSLGSVSETAILKSQCVDLILKKYRQNKRSATSSGEE